MGEGGEYQWEPQQSYESYYEVHHEVPQEANEGFQSQVGPVLFTLLCLLWEEREWMRTRPEMERPVVRESGHEDLHRFW